MPDNVEPRPAAPPAPGSGPTPFHTTSNSGSSRREAELLGRFGGMASGCCGPANPASRSGLRSGVARPSAVSCRSHSDEQNRAPRLARGRNRRRQRSQAGICISSSKSIRDGSSISNHSAICAGSSGPSSSNARISKVVAMHATSSWVRLRPECATRAAQRVVRPLWEHPPRG
jgi:hypothetical protein